MSQKDIWELTPPATPKREIFKRSTPTDHLSTGLKRNWLVGSHQRSMSTNDVQSQQSKPDWNSSLSGDWLLNQNWLSKGSIFSSPYNPSDPSIWENSKSATIQDSKPSVIGISEHSSGHWPRNHLSYQNALVSSHAPNNHQNQFNKPEFDKFQYHHQVTHAPVEHDFQTQKHHYQEKRPPFPMISTQKPLYQPSKLSPQKLTSPPARGLAQPNRFVARQLESVTREPFKRFDQKKKYRGDVPIGIFLWGFPESIKIGDLIKVFSSFGDFSNVGIDVKHGNRYAYMDFDDPSIVYKLLEEIPKTLYFNMRDFLSVRARYEKNSTPYFERHSEIDYKTIHITNCPHNINKMELEALFKRVAEIKRIKIFQRAVEKKASAFITFRNPESAKRALVFIEQQPAGVFKESNEVPTVEYPASDSSKIRQQTIQIPPDAQWENIPIGLKSECFGTLSKKARKLAAAENRIVYIRQLELGPDELKRTMLEHGPIRSMHIIEKEPVSTCFIVYESAEAAAKAIAAKAGGCTLPRHKRVDLPDLDTSVTFAHVKSFFESVAEIKQITLASPETPNVMVEFVTAVGAAKGIVYCRQVPFQGKIILADYAPSIKIETEETKENEPENPAADVQDIGSEMQSLAIAE